MTKTQPIEHIELTIGPAAVFSLAAALRNPPTQSGQIQSFSQFDNGLQQSRRARRGRPRLYLVAANSEISH